MWSCLKSLVQIQTVLVYCVMFVRLMQGKMKDLDRFFSQTAAHVHRYVWPFQGSLHTASGLNWNYPCAVKGTITVEGTLGLLSYGLTLLFLGVLFVSPTHLYGL